MKFPWYKRNKKGANAGIPDKAAKKEMLVEALGIIGAEFNSDEKDQINEFEYQGGIFVSEIYDEGSFISIVMPNIMIGEISDLNEIRYACHEVGALPLPVIASYFPNSEDNSVRVHLSVDISATDSAMLARDLKEAVEGMFEARRAFAARYHVARSARGENDPYDFEYGALTRGRRMELVRELEAKHDAELLSIKKSVERLKEESEMTVGRFCYTVFDFKPDEIDQVWLSIPGKESRIVAEDAWRRQSLFSLLYGERAQGEELTPLAKWATVMITTKSEEAEQTARCATLTLLPAGSSASKVYMKVVAAADGFDPVDGGAIDMDDTLGKSVTTMMEHPRVMGNALQAEYEYMLEDAREKIAGNLYDKLTAEQRLLMNAYVAHGGYCLYHGMRSFLAGHFGQAIPYLRNAYEDMHHRGPAIDAESEASFQDVCFMLGVSYLNVKCPYQALFYLTLVFNTGNLLFDRAYVEALIGTDDPRTLELMDKMVAGIEEYKTKNKDNVDDTISDYYDYLRRRRVNVVMAHGELVLAEKMLRLMDKEESMKDFVREELDNIRKLRGNSGAEG